MSRFLKRKIGIAFWVLLILGLGFAIRPLRDAVDSGKSDESVSLINFFGGDQQRSSLVDHSGIARVNDPIFYEDDSGAWRQVGYIESLRSGKSDPQSTAPNSADVIWYADDLPINECELFMYRSQGDLQEVLAIMLPPEKRLRIQQRLAATMSSHGDELSKAFVPLVQESLKRSMPVIESEFRLAVERHRPEIDKLANHWNDEIVSKRLIPLAKAEIMPIVQKHGQPPAEEIGREIWNRASLWRFGWRAMADKTPFPSRNLVKEEWKRFVKKEAVPVLEAHMDDIVVAIQRILGDVATNKAVRKELAAVASEVAKDPATRELVRTLLKETLIDNDRLREEWKVVWSSEEAENALNLAGDRLEPLVRQIGDELFGSEEEGINPDFARVLRSQILNKDQQWIVALHAGANSGAINASKKSMPYPMVYVADKTGEPQ